MLQDKNMEYMKQMDNIQYNNDNHFKQLNEEISMISNNKIELESIVEIEKNK